MSADDYSVKMAPGVRVRVTRVWPLGALPYEGTIKTWNSNGDVIDVVDTDGDLHMFLPVEAISFWDDEKKVFVHLRDSSYKFEVLDAED